VELDQIESGDQMEEYLTTKEISDQYDRDEGNMGEDDDEDGDIVGKLNVDDGLVMSSGEGWATAYGRRMLGLPALRREEEEEKIVLDPNVPVAMDTKVLKQQITQYCPFLRCFLIWMPA